MALTNSEVAKIFNLTGQLIELHDGNPFKAKSFTNAAYAIKKYELPVLTLTTNELLRIPGFGRGLLVKIDELKAHGQLLELNQLLDQTPNGLLQVLELPGLGPKKVRLLWQSLGICSIGELAYACNENTLISLPGFGAKTQEKILQAIAFQEANIGKMRLSDALALEKNCFTWFAQKYPKETLISAGELLRKCEIINSLTFVWVNNNPNIQKHPFNQIVQLPTPIELPIPVYVYCCSAEKLGTAMLLATANDSFLTKHALTNMEAFATPEEALSSAKLPDLAPVLWEDFYSKADLLTLSGFNLIKNSQFKGSIHNHTTFSDGLHSLQEMATEAIEMGLSYLVICDHSQAAFYANGLSPERVKEQWAAIDELNKKLKPFKIFKGIEADILSDGSLDYDEDLLKGFDLVVASVHSNLKMTPDKATERLLKAIKNPFTNILGHPTGRLLAARQGYEPDMQQIIKACKENHVAIELNANPYRLDVDWRHLFSIKQMDVKISINPDAHRKSGLHDMQYGAWIASKGGIEASDVLNCLDLAAFEAYILFQKSKRN